TFVGEGTATIVVHVEGANDIELKVNVYDPENHRINFKTNNMYETEDGFVMYEGETGNITVIIKGKDRTNEGTYTSGDDNVVTVDNENIHGKIYAIHQGNTSINIHVPDTEEDKVVNVIVKPKPQLEEDTFNILLGNTPQIKVNINGEPVNCAFESDNNDIATVDSTGKITVTGIGNTIVYANYDDGIKVHKLPVTITTTKTVTNDQGVSSTILTETEKETMIKRLMDTGMISNENDVEDIVVIDDSDLDQIIITIDRKDGQKVAVICYQDGTIKYIDTEEVQNGTVTINVAGSEQNIFAKENASGEMETVVVPGFYDSNNKLLASWELVTGDKIEGGALIFDSNGNKQTVTTSKNVDGGTETVWGWDYARDWNYWENNNTPTHWYYIYNKHYTILNNAKKMVIPDGVTYIGQCIFMYCSVPIETIVFPNSYNSYKNGVIFTYSTINLKNYTIRSDNPTFDSIDGVIYTEDHKTLVICPMNKQKVKILDGTENIYASSFLNNSVITSVGPYDSNADILVPNSVKSIQTSCFYSCTNLKWIEFNDNLEFIPAHIALGASNLRAIYLPKSVTQIGTSYDAHENHYFSFVVGCPNVSIYCERKSTDTNYLGTAYNWPSIWNYRNPTSSSANPAPVYYDISREWFRTNCEN
ncbi:leucine-rich repeat protein, partial [bacterium]|nr:leucine-rich repeat protein [bacterium]